ncbi:bola-like protein [Lipomyces oligophaga]|uniref:bola-like protein n=1 Tax=Lipomyces oligophaga TaxID=45792 RepID=UPI0034CDFD81
MSTKAFRVGFMPYLSFTGRNLTRIGTPPAKFLGIRMSTISTTVEPDFSQSDTPYESRIRWVLTQTLSPTRLEIYNDSHKHSHHKPMIGSTNKETHFRIEVVSDAFEGKRLPIRHREIYKLFSKEMAEEGGVHAMQLLTLTPKEWADRQAR